MILSTIDPKRLTDVELQAEIDSIEAYWTANYLSLTLEERRLWADRDWDLRGERSARANRNNPISGRPGHPGYDRFCDIAASWGYP